MNLIEQYSQLIRKYFANLATKEEKEQMQGLMNDPTFLQAWSKVWREQSYPIHPGRYPDPKQMLENILSDPRVEKSNPASYVAEGRQAVFYKKWWQVAAVFFALFGAVLWAYHTYRSDGVTKNELTSTLPVVPGSDKAMIILENGKAIDLSLIKGDTVLDQGAYLITKNSQGEISYSLKDGSSSADKIVYNTIVTPKGGEYNLKMADGSLVLLNAGSKIKYPVRFAAATRAVELEGEAYFEVAKMEVRGKRIPFIVKSGAQTLEVLGTHFNIKSFGDHIVTTLVKGKVKLSFADGGLNAQVLAPNDQVTFNHRRATVQKEQVDPFYSLAWKNGNFAFDNASIHSVMDEVARWYDVDIKYEDQLEGQHFSGTISRYENIDKLLKTISFAGGVHFERKGRRIHVLK